MKRNANTATVAAEKAAVAQHTTTERKSAERSTSMKRNANTTAANAAVAKKPMTIDVIDTGWSFTPTSVTLFGHEFPASKYAIAKDGSVYVLATVEDGATRLHFGKESRSYHAALEAAVAFKAQPKAEKPAETAAEPAKPVETKAAEPAKQAKPATKRKAPAKAAKQPAAKAAKPAAEPAKPVETKPAKAAKQPKAAKPAKQAKPAAEPAKPVAVPADGAWIGTTIEGKGWRIAFDEAAQRTRVIFDATPSAKQKAAIDAAGFYWSNTTKSWNKKLTRKAYRAAVALAETLNALK